MGSGLVIDDGGSTRVKWMKQGAKLQIVGEMEGLMNVQRPKGKGLAKGKSTHDILDSAYNQVQVVHIYKGMSPNEITRSNFKCVRISSHLGQSVEIQKTGTGLNVSLSGDLVEPVVEARQHDRKRRYIVSNSGQIEKIEVIDATGYAETVFDITTIPSIKDQPIYTSVILT